MSRRVKVRRCVGFGPYFGKCNKPAGTPHSPLFCPRCDKLRLEKLTQQLKEMVESFDKKEDREHV